MRPGVLLTGLLVACLSTSPGSDSDSGLVITGPPDLSVVVVQSTYQEFAAPDGYHHSQYAIWVANLGDSTPHAGIVFGATGPVFIRTGTTLTRATAASISQGDAIEVWRTGSVSYGAVQAPPGAPCYQGLQIVIVRYTP